MQNFFKMGEQADALMNQGDTRQAISIYSDIGREMTRLRVVDLYVVGKITLGTLSALAKDEAWEPAFKIWTAKDGLYALGISGIEQGQISVYDAMLYRLISARLHGLASRPAQEAKAAVDETLAVIVDWARAEKQDSWLPFVVGTWLNCYDNITNGQIPSEWRREIESRTGLSATRAVWTYPVPDAWNLSWAA